MVETEVRRDREQPGAKARLAAKARDARERTQQRLLDEIRGVVGMRRHPKHKRAHTAQVRLGQACERVAIAAGGEREQRGLVFHRCEASTFTALAGLQSPFVYVCKGAVM